MDLESQEESATAVVVIPRFFSLFLFTQWSHQNETKTGNKPGSDVKLLTSHAHKNSVDKEKRIVGNYCRATTQDGNQSEMNKQAYCSKYTL